MTVTNIVGPLMMYLDRFVIGSVLSVAAVAYYTTPHEMVTKFCVVPSAISGVLFPAFATHWSSAPEKAARMLERGAMYTLTALFPTLLIVAIFARELLTYWLGVEFAEQGTLVLQWLAAGVLINGVALIYFAFLQGAGRSDWTAKLHLSELLPYWLVLWFLLARYGIAGAAAAWFLRVAVDAAALMLMATKLNRALEGSLRGVAWLSVAGTGLVLSAMFLESIELRLSLFMAIMVLFLFLVWQRLLGPAERVWLRNFQMIKRG